MNVAVDATSLSALEAALAEGAEPAFAAFVRAFFAHAAPQDMAAGTPENLIALARAAFELSERRPGRARILAIRNIAGADVLIAVNPDMPFLYDSLMGELNAQGLSIRAAFHPILMTPRDAQGARADAGQPQKESFICVPFENVSGRREEDILAACAAVLEDVAVCVEDWPAMRERCAGAVRDLRNNPPPLAPEDIGEAIAFLDWLRDDHFLFLGCRDYDFEGRGEGELKARADSGLGILRDPERRVIRGGQDRVSLTPEVRAYLMQPSPLILTKSAVTARVHRRVAMDYVGVKRFDAAGRLAGERRFVGLFTSAAYHRSPVEIPLLRRKVRTVVARSGFPPESHSGKALMNVLETFPRDELFQTPEDDLYTTALGILHVNERPQTQVFLRFDQFDRSVSAQLFIPRARFNAEVIDRVAAILSEAFGGQVAAVYPQFGDAAVGRAYIIIARRPGPRPAPDMAALQEAIVAATQNWGDMLMSLVARAGTAPARQLGDRYAAAFDGAYRENMSPAEGVRDMLVAERLRGGGETGPVVELYARAGDPTHGLRVKLFLAKVGAELSATLPLLENFGLRVLEERPYRIAPKGADGFFVALHDFRMELAAPQPLALAEVKPLFEEAFGAVWSGTSENDGFNRLVLAAGLSDRDVTLIRALAKFLRQAGLTFSQAYVEEALARNADVARHLVRLFHARFDPALAAAARDSQQETLNARIDAALADVKSLDDDRILRRFRNAIVAMTRTSAFQRDAQGRPRPTLAFKFESARLDDLPRPRPFAEIFVYSPRVEGVHLRFGRVARGGLRWSDRREDFRTEVLGLVKAQQVKNAVIVPVGAKGGFFPKQLPQGGTREAEQAEGTAAYRLFVGALLDLTDNLVGEALQPPPDTVRHDGDDPYLVVAADKGTATFSDLANAIAGERGFWLGDAFASGGSNGYDHKKMGITARGAWEAVKRHFREMGRDTQTEPFTVVGVGDMSGDVFGNGMLLSDRIHLVAAFDHRDIFIDPSANSSVAHRERRRLFALPRSSWADYDPGLISEGGGVFSRKAKAIALTPQMKALTGLEADRVTPQDLIKALLALPVDLLWFGGIGTFVKDVGQSHADVGDRANDAIRIDAQDLRAKVVGEGANLGLTQAARIAFARAGGRINTDAIDNSAGVDTSDHEVNLKILLNAAVAGGALPQGERDALLAAMTEEVGRLVLRDNYEQTLALTVAEASAAADLDDHMRHVRALERRGRLDRRLEGLPGDDAVRERAQRGEGLTRPELAVLLAYAKLTLFEDVIETALPDEPAFMPLFSGYFPAAAAARFAGELPRHRLRREITATVLVNTLVNAGGPLLVHRLREATGAEPTAILKAAAVARAAFRLDALWDEINALDGRVPAAVQTSLHQGVRAMLQREALWMLRNVPAAAPVAETIARFQSGVDALRGTFSSLVTALEAQGIEGRIAELESAGVPLALAEAVAVAPAMAAVPDIVTIAESAGLPLDAVAGAFFAAGAAAGIDRLHAGAERLALASYWDRLAVARLADDLFIGQRALALKALVHLAAGGGATRADGVAAVTAWSAAVAKPLEQARGLIAELERTGPLTIAKLTLAASQLRDLSGG